MDIRKRCLLHVNTHAAAMCGPSARIKFDDEQFAALFNELQSRGDKAKLMQFVWTLINLTHEMCYNSVLKMIF